VSILGHYAGNDDFAPPAAVEELRGQLVAHARRVDLLVYEGEDHAFFNDARPDVYSAESAQQAWERTIAFFREELA
jgi:carboxymethylenebutenolidase